MMKYYLSTILSILFHFVVLSQEPEYEYLGECWYGERANGGSYQLIIFGNSKNIGSYLSLSGAVDGDECYWQEIETNDGYYHILNGMSGLYLQPEKNPPVIGSKIKQAAPNGTDIQKWIIVNAGEYDYYYVPKLNPDVYITVQGANVNLQSFSGENQQHYMCFPKNTPIKTSNQGFVSIQDVTPGTEVFSWNKKLNRFENAKVQRIDKHENGKFVLTKVVFTKNKDLYASEGKELELYEIEGTWNHPILTNHGLKMISELNTNDTLLYYEESTGDLQECTILELIPGSSLAKDVYNVVLDEDHLYMVNGLLASPKCPFVYVFKDGNQQCIDEILKNQISCKLDKYDMLEIPLSKKERVVKIKLSEEKNEITFLDHIYLKIGGQMIYPINSIKKIESDDDNYLTLRKGESVELLFEIPANLEVPDKGLLYAKGYYDLIPISKK